MTSDNPLDEIPEMKAFVKFSSVDEEDPEESEETQEQPQKKPQRDSLLVQDLISLGETADFNQQKPLEVTKPPPCDDDDVTEEVKIEDHKEPLYDSVPDEATSEIISPIIASSPVDAVSSEISQQTYQPDDVESSLSPKPTIPPKSSQIFASSTFEQSSQPSERPFHPNTSYASEISSLNSHPIAPSSPKLARPELPPPPIPAKQNSPRLNTRAGPKPPSAPDASPLTDSRAPQQKPPSASEASPSPTPSRVLQKILSGSAVATPLAGIGFPAGGIPQLRSTKTETYVPKHMAQERVDSKIEDGKTHPGNAIVEGTDDVGETTSEGTDKRDELGKMHTSESVAGLDTTSGIADVDDSADYAYVVRIQSPAKSKLASASGTGSDSRRGDPPRSSFSSFTSFRYTSISTMRLLGNA